MFDRTRPIGPRCVLSVLRYAFCDGGSGGVGGGGGGILSPRMILSSKIVRFQRKMKRHNGRTYGHTDIWTYGRTDGQTLL